MADPLDIGRYFLFIRQPDSGNFPQSRIGLFRGHGFDYRANAPFKGSIVSFHPPRPGIKVLPQCGSVNFFPGCLAAFVN